MSFADGEFADHQGARRGGRGLPAPVVAVLVNLPLGIVGVIPYWFTWSFLADFVFARFGWTTANPYNTRDGAGLALGVTLAALLPYLLLAVVVNWFGARRRGVGGAGFWALLVAAQLLPAVVLANLPG
ncbi:hypothetical protein GCM10009639_07390 [Kitasatospora putterlickiae]|uniref:DUF805 domain-containing protein n=1 Tax=Kitasatospora putterlickiae TaxID=221725 RepID=A0ABN1XMG5_9ACTN